MWINFGNSFEDLSYADDIMMPSLVSDSDHRNAERRIDTRSNFGSNNSEVMVDGGKMGIFTGAYRYPSNMSTTNMLAYTMVKGLTVDLGSEEPEARFTTADILFIGRVLTVAAFLEIPSTCGHARDDFNPVPAWKFSTQVGEFDVNDNGEGNSTFNGLINCSLDDAETCETFFDKLEQCLLLQAVSPRRYIIRKDNKNFTNTGLAAKIIMTLNKVRVITFHYERGRNKYSAK